MKLATLTKRKSMSYDYRMISDQFLRTIHQRSSEITKGGHFAKRPVISTDRRRK